MRLKCGKHEGKTPEEVVLKHPDYAQWMIEHSVFDHQAMIWRMRKFDEIPFTKDCHRECGRKATRASACGDSSTLYFWCDKCDPLSIGARGVRIINTLNELLQHVDLNAGNNGLKRRMVRQLAKAKSLPKRVGEEQALEFFSQAPTDDSGPPIMPRLKKRGRLPMFRR